MSERCGYAVTDSDGEQQPCDRPATDWRWYQDVGEHEDLLDAACDWHANEGGRRIHEAEAALARVRALAGEWQSWSAVRSTPRIDTFRDAAEQVIDALDGEQ